MTRFIKKILLALCLTELLILCAAAETSGDAGAPSSAVSASRAQVFYDRGRYDEALTLVNQALDADKWYFPLWKLKGKILCALNRTTEMDEVMSTYFLSEPDDVAFKAFWLKSILSRRASPEERKKLGDNFWALEPDPGAATKILAAYLEEYDEKKIRPQLLATWPESSENIKRLGQVMALCDAGQYLEASAQVLQGPWVHSKESDLESTIAYRIAEALYEEKSYPACWNILTALEQASYSAVKIAQLSGNLYRQTGEPEKAAQSWEKMWRLAEEPDLWLVRIADAYYAASKDEEVLRVLETAVNAFPRNPLIQGRYMLILHVLGKEEPLDEYRRRLDGLNYPLGLAYGKALIAHAKKDESAAQTLMSSAASMNKDQQWSLFLFDRGSPERPLKVVPDAYVWTEDTREAIKLRDRGWTYWKARNYDMAVKMWTEALDIGFPDSRDFILNVSMRLLEAGRSGLANSLVQRVIPNRFNTLSFLSYLVRTQRWYVVPLLLRGYKPAQGDEELWVNLYMAYASLRMGRAADLHRSLNALKRLPAPSKEMAVPSVNEKFDIIEARLTTQHYCDMVAALCSTAAAQKNIDLLLQLVSMRHWYSLNASTRSAILKKAAREFLNSRNGPAFQALSQSRQWKELNVKLNGQDTFTASLVMLEQKDVTNADAFQGVKWNELSPRERLKLYVEAGELYYSYGDQPRASEYFTKALAIDGSHADANLYMALIAATGAAHDAAAASQYVAKARSKGSPKLRYLIYAETERLAGHEKKSLALYKTYFNEAPDDYGRMAEVIQRLLALGETTEAQRYTAILEKASASGSLSATEALARARYEFGDYEGAESLWSGLLTKNPNNLNYLVGYGDALLAQGKHEKLMAGLERPAFSSLDPRLMGLLIQCYIDSGRTASVPHCVDLALNEQPGDSRFQNLGMQASEILGDKPESYRYASELLKKDPYHINTRRILIESLLALKDERGDLKEALDRYGEMNPKNEQVLRARVEVAKEENKADSSRLVKKLDQQIAEEFPQDPNNSLKYAVSAAGDGDYRTAFKTLEPMIALGSNAALLACCYPSISPSLGVTLEEFKAQLKLFIDSGCVTTSLKSYRASVVENKSDARSDKPEPIQLLIIICASGTTKATILEVDKLLEEAGGRASLAVDGTSLAENLPSGIDLSTMRTLNATGRWDFILSDFTDPKVTEDDAERSFWTTRITLEGQRETETEMVARLSGRMGMLRGAALAGGFDISTWIYPNGDWGQLSVKSDETTVSAVKMATNANFAIAFAPTDTGYWISGEDHSRIPMKYVYRTNFDEEAQKRLLTERHPTRSAVFEAAKVASWNGQIPRAKNLFERARELGVGHAQMDVVEGRNYYYGEDYPNALERGLKARDANVMDKDARKLVKDVGEQMSVHAGPNWRDFKDSDGNYEKEWGLDVSGYVTERLKLGLGYSDLRVGDDIGEITGSRIGLNARYHVGPLQYLDGSLWLTRRSGFDDFFGGRLSYNGVFDFKNWNANGTWNVFVGHDSVNTRKAIEKDITATEIGAATSFRLNNDWDVDLGLTYANRSDNNDTFAFNFRPMYRLMEAPLVKLGYWFQYGDSNVNPDEYYAPVNSQSHVAVVMANHVFNDRFSVGALLGWGVGKSGGGDWHSILRANVDFRWQVIPDLWLSFGYRHFETSDYDSDEFRAWFEYVF